MKRLLSSLDELKSKKQKILGEQHAIVKDLDSQLALIKQKIVESDDSCDHSTNTLECLLKRFDDGKLYMLMDAKKDDGDFIFDGANGCDKHRGVIKNRHTPSETLVCYKRRYIVDCYSYDTISTKICEVPLAEIHKICGELRNAVNIYTKGKTEIISNYYVPTLLD
jgi:hypothetical protein